MTHPHLAFIGAGNMATSIIGGLIEKGYPSAYISAADPNEENRSRMSQDFGINTNSSNIEVITTAKIVVLAVKPQIMKNVVKEISMYLPTDTVLISIAAGISCQSLTNWLGKEAPIVRCMPNTPSLVQVGASGLFANNACSDAQRKLAQDILSAVGIVCWLDNESDIDPVTAVSGSGPAYFFFMMEAMIAAGVKQGLSEDVARQLTLQTALGAATLAQQSDVGPAELRRRVTSPGGTTEQAIQSFEKNEFAKIVEKAMQACSDRSVAMAKELGN